MSLGIGFYLIATGPNTLLLGETLDVDDSHREVLWRGLGWSKAENILDEHNANYGMAPFGMTLHQTNQVGDSFRFSFTGEGNIYSESGNGPSHI